MKSVKTTMRLPKTVDAKVRTGLAPSRHVSTYMRRNNLQENESRPLSQKALSATANVHLLLLASNSSAPHVPLRKTLCDASQRGIASVPAHPCCRGAVFVRRFGWIWDSVRSIFFHRFLPHQRLGNSFLPTSHGFNASKFQHQMQYSLVKKWKLSWIGLKSNGKTWNWIQKHQRSDVAFARRNEESKEVDCFWIQEPRIHYQGKLIFFFK